MADRILFEIAKEVWEGYCDNWEEEEEDEDNDY